jgi:hypothetical protein
MHAAQLNSCLHAQRQMHWEEALSTDGMCANGKCNLIAPRVRERENAIASPAHTCSGGGYRATSTADVTPRHARQVHDPGTICLALEIEQPLAGEYSIETVRAVKQILRKNN